jgi:preprotein translocase SecE subunit
VAKKKGSSNDVRVISTATGEAVKAANADLSTAKTGRRLRLPKFRIRSPKFLKKIWVPKFIRRIGGYFAGAWRELREVRWPNRRATWQLTVAVLLFTAFWMIVVLLLDVFYQFVLNKLFLQ